MVAPEYHRAYRRGIVLGLSLAELFILLVFLLLLALIGYALSRDDQAAQQAQTIADQREQLDALAPIVDADPSELEQRIVQLEREKSDAERRAEEAEQQARMFRNENTALHEAKEALEEERGILEERAEASEKAAESAEAARQAAEQKYQQAEQREKRGDGQTSPCWYKVVQKQGEDIEEPLYIFDLRISDETVLVQNYHRSLPPDAHTPEPEYDRAALGRELPYAEFMREFEPMKIAGRNKEVRDRWCLFHVRMWDNTSNKTAYKRASNQFVHQVFVPTPVERDPWPH